MKFALGLACVNTQASGAPQRPTHTQLLTMTFALNAAAAAAAAATLWYLFRRHRGNAGRMAYDFDQVFDRSAYPTVKHDMASLAFGGQSTEGTLKMWVADMELLCCPPIQDAIRQRAAHPDFGYTLKPSELWPTVGRWLVQKQGWSSAPPPEAFIYSATVVGSASSAIRALTAPGDAVLAMTPLYGPLQGVVAGSGRKLVTLQLRRREHGGYDMDLSDNGAIEQALPKVSALILCNPHNPSGRVWRLSELSVLASLCARHNVLVICDEIWADWTLDAHPFAPFRDAARAVGCQHVILGAPSKTWSMAGVHASYAIIEDDALRRAFLAWVEPAFLCYANTFGSVAMLAAYTHGAPWIDACKRYVEGNLDYLEHYLSVHVPRVVPLRPEAGYLVWLDCSRLRLGAADLSKFMLRRARLALSAGAEFDPPGMRAADSPSACFQRINVACRRQMLVEALEQLKEAVDSLCE